MSSATDPAWLNRMVRDVHRFATEAAKQSRLPGLNSGPGDAFRHMVGTAELTRRLGALPAFSAVEFNETLNWANEQFRRLSGRAGPIDDTAAARAMDRTNNAVGIRIGLRARTPLDVLEAARFEIERANELGAGTRDAATWLPVRVWGPSITTASNWPPRDWPDFGSTPATLEYEGVGVPSR